LLISVRAKTQPDPSPGADIAMVRDKLCFCGTAIP
jgi:hypothetical protein